MLFFQQSDEELLAENLNRVESENANLREQIEDMERELDFKERKVTEMEAEVKVLRGEREQFVEMQVRLEIQHKELGLIMRDQKDSVKKKSPRTGDNKTSGAKTDRHGMQTSVSSKIKSFKSYV